MPERAGRAQSYHTAHPPHRSSPRTVSYIHPPDKNECRHMNRSMHVHPSETLAKGGKQVGLRPTARRTFTPRTNLFDAVNAAAEGQIESLCRDWLGRCERSGLNLMALNPTRADKNIGSFGIHVRTGVWADFATGDRGGDIISFYAYIRGLKQIEAARELAGMLGVQA